MWNIRYNTKSIKNSSIYNLEENYINEQSNRVNVKKTTFLASSQSVNFIYYQSLSVGVAIDVFFSPWSQRYELILLI